ncbi:MAG: mechanosensitive ion channel family protein [Candidatus Pseudobacter hemicellulosilyticus]|uniref:Mechanosensitive ion channel family protein n=1 Tax=Candidatus Pseudobacter hemicellulosilyticus TaxID=3121375 RepID=A0AAJ6BFU2_9BACT|nr:MAG: mechanosensitive ion channel family protein [Pseudobacter sp.]
MDQFWAYRLFNNTVKDWTIAIGIIVVSMLVLRLLRTLITKKLSSLTAKTKTTIDDFIISIVQSCIMPILYIVAVYMGLQYLEFPEKVRKIERAVLMVVSTYFVLRIITRFMGYFVKEVILKKEENSLREKQSKSILIIVQIVVWIAGIIFLMDNMGYDITALVAGLGIGGIAIALAAQTILGDLFSYVVIFFDKPFEIGDFVILDDKLGSIESIGIKTTRIRTLSGEQLVISNTDLTNSRVHNYKRMQHRRIVFAFNVFYNTPVAKLRQIPDMIKETINALEGTRFDRAHFQSFGDAGYRFEIVYHVLSPDYNIYMDKQQHINFAICEILESTQVEFAFTTQRITRPSENPYSVETSSN